MKNPFDPGYFTELDLANAGFQHLGQNIRISKNCTIMGTENISIGNNVRIDAYCSILATGNGRVRLGSYIHVGHGCFLAAGEGIIMEDFSGLSQGVHVYTRTDDYTGKYLTNPTVPDKYKNVFKGGVTLGRHVIVGSGSVILPRVTLGEGVSVGALSLVTKSLESWGVYFGMPVKRIKSRSKQMLKLEEQLRRDYPKSLD